MKYYLYISEAKVNMLYAQIPADLKSQIGTKIGIHLGVVSAEVNEEPKEKALIEKLQVVERYILEHEDVGPVAEYHSYMYEKAELCMGVCEDILFFLDDNFMLVGSAYHLIGAPTQAPKLGGSHLSAASLVVKALFGEEIGSKENLGWLTDVDRVRMDIRSDKVLSDGLDEGLNGYDKCKTVNVEFLAKHLRGNKRKFLVATPIYVALLD